MKEDIIKEFRKRFFAVLAGQQRQENAQEEAEEFILKALQTQKQQLKQEIIKIGQELKKPKIGHITTILTWNQAIKDYQDKIKSL